MTSRSLLALIPLVLLAACGGSSAPPTDGAPGAPCDDEGAMRAGTCGNCGMVSELCTGGVWTPQGACLGEGPCGPGTTESGTLPLCGEQQRICGNDCQWSDWTVITPGTGECEPGEVRFQQEDCGTDMFRRQECSGTCAWVTQADPCVDGCGDVPRATANEDEDEVCILAGPFIRGLMGEINAEPVTTVMLSPYYTDKYQVTNRRYKACYDTGVCGGLVPSGQTELLNPAKADYQVIGLNWAQARDFCEWDGGRRLLTEAEWEKAARGPAPRDNRFVWDGTTWRCDLLTVSGCPGFVWASPYPEAYNAHPGDSSYYGVRGMMGGGITWNHDFWAADYFADPSSLIDPQGPSTGMYHSIRGAWRFEIGQDRTISPRYPGTSPSYGVRCGRSAPGL